MEVPGPSNEPENGNESPSEILTKKKRVVIKSSTDIYELIGVVGSGSYGKVYRAYAEIMHIDVAIKFFYREDRELPKKEMKICRLFKDSKYVVHVFELFEHNGRPCLVFEFIPDTLKHYIKNMGPFPISLIRNLTRQLLKALKELKLKNIVHCDLKPSNIMVHYWNKPYVNLKLVDFGGAMTISQCSYTNIMQTKVYKAPEVIIGAPKDEKIDMWSMGCIVAEMLAARCLYPAEDDNGVLAMIIRCQGPVPHDILAKGFKTDEMFNLVGGDHTPVFQMISGAAPEPSSERGYYKFQTDSLDELVEFDPDATDREKALLLDLLKSMLHLDAGLRCTPEEALEHEFFKTGKDVARCFGKLSLEAERGDNTSRQD